MPGHGEIVDPKDRFITYAYTIDISDEALLHHGEKIIESRFLADAAVRTRRAVAEIDKYAPIIITMGAIHILPKPTPFTTRWGVHVRVEIWRYVYDDTWRLEEEWKKELRRRYKGWI